MKMNWFSLKITFVILSTPGEVGVFGVPKCYILVA